MKYSIVEDKPTYTISLTDQLHFNLSGKIPNMFHRVMFRFLLGIKFEKINNI